MYTYYIISDKELIVNRIKHVLNDYPNINYSGNSGNYNIAVNSIHKEFPNLLFIDLDTLKLSSFELIKEVNYFTNKYPFTIALSLTDKYAYKAIKSGFLDYLLKPLTELDIRKSILKANQSISNHSASTVCLRSYKDYQYLNTEEILFLKADNNATDFQMMDGNIISAYKTLKTFEELLPDNFLRIHKSYIINSNYVSRINYGKYVCTIKRNSFNIPFTKTYIDNVQAINKILSKSSIISLN